MQIYLLGALLFLIAMAIFVFQNPAVVTVHFLTWVSPDVSIAVVALMAACAGALAALLADSFRYIKVAKRINELNSQNKKLQNEIKSMKKDKDRQPASEKTADKTAETDSN